MILLQHRKQWTRKELLTLLRDESRLILDRALAPGADKPYYSLEHLEWYLDLSRDWAIVTLAELFATPPGAVLDVGASFGLIAGCAWRNGWKVSAVDVSSLPNFSGLAIPDRQVDFAVCNVSVDPLPFADGQFDAVLLNEVLEHLLYPPTLLFSEIRRVVKPGARLYLTTPNPAAVSKIIRLIRGLNNEPDLDVFMTEETFTHKGLTFFTSCRESKVWTVQEMKTVLEKSRLKVIDYSYYGNTVSDSRFISGPQRFKRHISRWIRPFVKRNRLAGGGTLVIAEAR